MTRAAALTTMRAGQAFGRRRQDRDGGSCGIGGDRIKGLGGMGGRLRGAGSVKAGEVNQCICGLCWVTERGRLTAAEELTAGP